MVQISSGWGIQINAAVWVGRVMLVVRVLERWREYVWLKPAMTGKLWDTVLDKGTFWPNLAGFEDIEQGCIVCYRKHYNAAL